MTARESVVVAVDPATVYAAVSDPTQTRRWSPENRGAVLDQPSAALTVGSTFVGQNKRGPARWSTRCRVTVAEPDTCFAFRVEAIGVRTPRLGAPISLWEYRLAAVEGGTEVTETWSDLRTRWPDWAARGFDKIATGSTFPQFNRGNIRRTLDRLKITLEAEAAATEPRADGTGR